MFPQRNLNPRFQQHIARARRMRIIGGALLVTCLLIGTGAALSQTQLPYQAVAIFKPFATELGNAVSQLPSAISQRTPDVHLPTAQLAASATSFPQSVAQKVRNLFCRWLGCESDTLLAQQPPQPSIQQRATFPQNVNPPAPIPPTSPSDVARSATTTSQVVVSNPASNASPSSASAQQVIQQPVIERTNTVIQSGITEALLDARLLALTNDLNSRLAQVAAARTYQAERTAENIVDALRIEQLTGLTAHDLTVDGVSGLTDADLPDSLTASNYLPLSGGTLTGDLAIGGTLSASTLSVAGISSGGAIEAPYFTATSSTATSTFAGPIFTLGPAQFANSSNFFGETKFGATGTTTIATNGTISTPSIIANSATLYSATLGSLTATTSLAVSYLSSGSLLKTTTDGAVIAATAGTDYLSGALAKGNFLVGNDAGVAQATSSIFVSSTGQVGIGITTPAAKLTVAGGDILIDNSAAFRSRDSGGTVRALMALSSANNLQIGGTSGTVAGSIFMLADSDIRFSPGSGAGANETVRFAASGNVGIGVTAPVSKLQVAGANTALPTTNVYQQLEITSTGAARLSLGTLSGAVGGGAIGTGIIQSLVNASSFTNLSLNPSGGNVGIGTTTPATLLTISSASAPALQIDNADTSLVLDQVVGALEFNTNDVSANGTGVAAAIKAITESSTGSDQGLGFFTKRGQNSIPLTEYMRITSSGNIGIGTTSPYSKLQTLGTASDASLTALSTSIASFTNGSNNLDLAIGQMSASPYTSWIQARDRVTNGNAYPLAINPLGGNVGLGTTSPSQKLHIYSSSQTQGLFQSTDTFSYLMLADSGSSVVTGQGIGSNGNNLVFRANGGTRMTLTNTGNLGVASTTPWRTLSVTGTVGFDGLTGSTGAGSLCLDANKQVVYNDASDSCLSSTRETKHDIQPLTLNALGMIEGLEPVSFVYNEGNDRTRFGFIAEDTAAIDPHLATYNASGTVSGIDDRAILSILVAAIKEFAAKIAGFAETFTTKELIATNATFESVATKQLCAIESDGNQVCLTGDQLGALLSQTGAAATPTSVPSSPSNISEPEPPISVSSTSTPEVASSTPEALSPEAANDNQPAEEDASNATPDAGNDDVSAYQADILEPVNDDPPPEQGSSEASNLQSLAPSRIP